MSVVVTGASGHVGGNLVRALLAEGRQVRALVHQNAKALAGLDVERVKGDILDPASLEAALAGAETVYHSAARITLRGRRDAQALGLNVTGTRNVARACLAQGVGRLVHFSSIRALAALGGGEAVDESCPAPNPRTAMVYDRSKAAAEREVISAVREGLNAVIVLPTAVLGPHDYGPSAMGQTVIDLCRGHLPALVRGGADWVDVRDVCAGALAAEREGRTGERYLLGGHYVTLRQLADLIADQTGSRTPLFSFPAWAAYLGVPFAAAWARGMQPRLTRAALRALTEHSRVSHDKASRELGYRPRPVEETVTDTIAWFREAGLLES